MATDLMTPPHDNPDPMAPARGVITGALLGAAIWLALIGLAALAICA